ncbi:hypothetical protein BDV06DRAFT_208990 [Aspergillus oleicola]
MGTWERFKTHVMDACRESATVSGDRAVLEGASKDQLRAHFKAWREGVLRGEAVSMTGQGLDLDLPCEYAGPRLETFLQVDADSLKSIKEEFEEFSRLKGTGHVNLIRANWQSDLDSALKIDEPEELWKEGPFDSIEGCSDKDVGWMKMAFGLLGPSFYLYVDDAETWHKEYVRPPGVKYI